MTKATTTTTTTTTTKATPKNNGWERIAKRNLKNAYNWNMGEMEIARDENEVKADYFEAWIEQRALDEIYHEAITTLYTGDSCGGEAPKEMRFAGKEFCYKYLITLFKKDGYNVTAPELETKKATTTETTEAPKEESTMTETTTTKKATVKKPRAKKSTKTTKKAAEPTTITVVLKAFTGMKIAIYTGTLQDSTITITTKAGKTMEFNLDGTQKTLNPSKNPKFNNKIEVITEA